MALYAFDGTGNKDNPVDGKDTNVRKLFEAYEEGYEGPGACLYIPGVGTRWGPIGKFFGGIFGAGGKKRVGEAIEVLKRNFEKGDTTASQGKRKTPFVQSDGVAACSNVVWHS